MDMEVVGGRVLNSEEGVHMFNRSKGEWLQEVLREKGRKVLMRGHTHTLPGKKEGLGKKRGKQKV